MSPILALAIKDLRLLVRDKGGLFFTLVMPLLFGVFFGTIFGGEDSSEPKGVPVLLVDEDRSAKSIALGELLKKAEELRVEERGRAAAEELVRKGQRAAYILIPEGYGGKSSFFWGDPAEIAVGVDPSRKAEGAMLQGIVTKHAFRQMSETFTDSRAMLDQVGLARKSLEQSSGMNAVQRGILAGLFDSLDAFAAGLPELQATDPAGGDGAASAATKPGFEPIRVTVKDVERPAASGAPARPRSAYAVSFPQAMIWALIGSAASFGIGLVVERSKGTLTRLRTAPLGWSQLLAGKALACLITTLGAMAAVLAIGIIVFGIRPNSPGLLALAMLCAAICFVGIMMLLSVLGRTEASAAGIGWAVCLVMAMLGGGMVPLFIMPRWMQSMASVSPVKWAVLGFEGAIWRGFTLAEMLLPCAILLGVGALGFALGSRVFRRLEPA